MLASKNQCWMFQILPQQLSPGNSTSPGRVAHASSAVPPGLQYHPAPGENTQCNLLVQLELWKSAQEENQEVTGFMSPSQRHVGQPPTSCCHGWGWHWTLWLWEDQWHPSCWGGGERWCYIWVIAPARGLLFSQLCTAKDMPTVCPGTVSQCWLFSCTAMRSGGWALPLNFPSFSGIIFYL